MGRRQGWSSGDGCLVYEITGLGGFFNIAELQNAGSSKEVEGGTLRGGRAHCAWNAHPLNAHQDGAGEGGRVRRPVALRSCRVLSCGL